MAKKVISISCPQCKATDAQLLSDGTYQCKYCGTRFIIDDDTVTQNININVNVKHEQQYSNLRKTDTLGNEIYTRSTDDFTVDNYGILPAKGVGVSDKSLTVIPCIQNKKYRYLYVYGDADSTKIVMESIKDK